MKNLPNILTTIRFFLVPVFIFVYFKYEPWMALIVFILAGFTDLLDGYIARKKNLITDWGKVMDPLADKLMQVAVLFCLCIDGALPFFVLIIIVIKETIMVIGGAFLYKKRDIVVFSKIYGKIATALIFIGIVMTFFRQFLEPYNLYVIYAALVLSIFSMFMYGVNTLLKKNGEPKEEKKDITA
ncbi:MAG: CDP-alcohol phosphatidyltransferase family protein [Christensenellales bacterium]|jgi:cardiolipin synthase